MIQEATLPQSQQIQQHQHQHQHQQQHHHQQHRQSSKRKRLKSTQLSEDDANTSGSQYFMGVAGGWQNVEQNVRNLVPSSQSSSTTTATSSAFFDGGSRFSNGFQVSNDIISSAAHTSMDNIANNNGMNDIDEDITKMQTRNRSGLMTTTAIPTTNPAIIDDTNDGDIFDASIMPAYHPLGLPSSLSYQQSIIMNQMDMVANASNVDGVNHFGINHRLNHNTNSNSNNNNNNPHHICPHQQQSLASTTITTDTLAATTGSNVSITNVSSTPSSLDNLAQSLTVDNNHHHHHPNSFHQNHQHSSIRPSVQQPTQQFFTQNSQNGVGDGGTLASNGSETSSTSVSNIEKLCFGCRQTLSTSPIIATVSGYHNWHIHCLCCSECGQSLSQSRSCYGRNGRIYCKDDYIKSIKCCKCNRSISSTDWVRRAGTLVYHLACFACDICQRQLSTGEKFTIENLSANNNNSNNPIGYSNHPTNNRPNCKNDVHHSMIHSSTTALTNSNQNNYNHHHHHHHHHRQDHKNNSAYNISGNYRLVCKLHFGIKDEDVTESTVVTQSGSRALDLDQVPSIENGRLTNETLGHRIHPEDGLLIETGGAGAVDGNSGTDGNPFSTNPNSNNVSGLATIDPSAVTNQNSNLSNCGRNSSLSNSTTGTSTIQSATTPPSTTNSSCGGGGVGAGSGVGIGGNSKTKRVRTTFTEEQLSILQANFQIDSNPDGQDLERIAALTGLSKRVTQVWFQNSRARQKKFMSKSTSSSSSAHHHHHHHHHQPQSQQQRHQLMDDVSHPQAPVSLLINGQQPTLNRGNNSGCGVALWSPGTTTSNSSSSSNGVGNSSGNNAMQDNQPTTSESIMLLDSHHQHHRHHQMVVKNMAWNNPGSSSSSTMASMNETSKLNTTNESSELTPMTSNGNSSNNDGSIVGSL